MKKNRTYHSIFNEWNERSSYLLGFWLADGHIIYVRKGKGITTYKKRFCITNTDKQIMLKLQEILGCQLSVTNPTNNHKACYHIRLNSNELFDFCYSLVGTTQKTHAEIKIPVMPKEVFCHFIRGFFDGDGSICWITYKSRHGKSIDNLRTSFTAGLDTGKFLNDLLAAINDHVGIKAKNVVIGKHSIKIILGQYDSAKLCEWMYKNATIYMERKKRIWDDADKKKLFDSKKFWSHPSGTPE